MPTRETLQREIAKQKQRLDICKQLIDEHRANGSSIAALLQANLVLLRGLTSLQHELRNASRSRHV
jgi:hypothetical protein